MIIESLKLAFQSIWANKLRSILTMLGIVIGVASVIMFMAVGEGLRADVRSEVTALGSNLVVVLPGQFSASSGPNLSVISGDILKPEDVESLSKMESTDDVGAFSMVGQILRRDKTTAPNAILFGSTPNLTDLFTTIKIDRGRFFSKEDDSNKAKVIVLGPAIAKTLFGDNDPIDNQVQIGKDNFTVIGLTKVPEGSSIFGGSDYSTLSLIPLQTAGELSNGIKIMRILVKLNPTADVNQELPKLKSVMLERHAEEDFSLLTQDDILGLMDTVLKLLTAAVSAIAAISLIVAGVGIMNIMLVSVTERTKEIGLRKAVGATISAILWQFLIEAVVLSVTGVLIAVSLVTVGAQIVSRISPIEPVVTVEAISIAVGMGIAVGLIFGLAPAIRAARMDPIQALRYE